MPLDTPAPGFRHRETGALTYAGNHGFCWSSTASGIYSLDLRFYSQYLYASNGDYRALGFQLRCLSE